MRTEMSFTIFLRESKKVWRLCRKKWVVDSTSKLQEHNGFKQSWKLCLNLCSLRWLCPSLSLVSNLIPNGSWILNIEFWIGPSIFNKEFLKIKNDFAFLVPFNYSTWKERVFKWIYSPIICFKWILIMGVIYTISQKNNIEWKFRSLCRS